MKNTAPATLDSWWQELERAERVLGRVGPDDICCAGLTPRQTAILRTLVEREGARLSDLAAASGITASAMTRVLEKLEKRGLVERVRGAQEDGRAAMVRITEPGRRVRREIDAMMRRRCRMIIDAIPAAKRAHVLNALRIFNTALEQSDCCRAESSACGSDNGCSAADAAATPRDSQ